MTIRDRCTIVGIEPTTHGLAFVVFDDRQLLDWGTSVRTAKLDTIALLDRIVGRFGADLLVYENPDADGCRRGARVRSFLRETSGFASLRRLRAKAVARELARRPWSAAGHRTNQAVAAGVAEVFPVLRWLLPPPRKAFMPEDVRVRIFGAVMLVLFATKSLPPKLVS